MWPNPQFPGDLVTFTEEILNGKLHFLCREIRFGICTILFGPHFTVSELNCEIYKVNFCIHSRYGEVHCVKYTWKRPHQTRIFPYSGIFYVANLDQKKFAFGHFSRIEISSSVIFLLDYATTIGSFVHKKWSFPLRISSVNVTKSALSCGYGHIYWRKP